jgi:hypothetical protein
MTIGSKDGLSLLVSKVSVYVVFSEPCGQLNQPLECILYQRCDMDMPS